MLGPFKLLFVMKNNIFPHMCCQDCVHKMASVETCLM